MGSGRRRHRCKEGRISSVIANVAVLFNCDHRLFYHLPYINVMKSCIYYTKVPEQNLVQPEKHHVHKVDFRYKNTIERPNLEEYIESILV